MMNTAAEAITLEALEAKIKENISAYNLTSDAVEQTKLELALKKLEEDYSLLSRLTAWTGFIEDEQPMVAFAKAYEYSTIGHKDVPHDVLVDGGKKTVRTRVIDKTKKVMLNVADFVEWTEAHGSGCVAANENWRDMLKEAQEVIIDQWKGVLDAKRDTHTISIGQMTKVLQAMVDALVFIPGKKGGNAVKVHRKLAAHIFAFSTQRKKGLKGSILSDSSWKALQMDLLHAAVEGKTFTVTFGNEEPEGEQETAETTEATTEPTTK